MKPSMYRQFNKFFSDFAKQKKSELVFWEQVSQFTFNVILGVNLFSQQVWEITFTSKGCVYKQLS